MVEAKMLGIDGWWATQSKQYKTKTTQNLLKGQENKIARYSWFVSFLRTTLFRTSETKRSVEVELNVRRRLHLHTVLGLVRFMTER